MDIDPRIARLEAQVEERGRQLATHEVRIAQNSREIRDILDHLRVQEANMREFLIDKWGEVHAIRAQVRFLIAGGGVLGTMVAVLQIARFFIDLRVP